MDDLSPIAYAEAKAIKAERSAGTGEVPASIAAASGVPSSERMTARVLTETPKVLEV